MEGDFQLILKFTFHNFQVFFKFVGLIRLVNKNITNHEPSCLLVPKSYTRISIPSTNASYQYGSILLSKHQLGHPYDTSSLTDQGFPVGSSQGQLVHQLSHPRPTGIGPMHKDESPNGSLLSCWFNHRREHQEEMKE